MRRPRSSHCQPPPFFVIHQKSQFDWDVEVIRDSQIKLHCSSCGAHYFAKSPETAFYLWPLGTRKLFSENFGIWGRPKDDQNAKRRNLWNKELKPCWLRIKHTKTTSVWRSSWIWKWSILRNIPYASWWTPCFATSSSTLTMVPIYLWHTDNHGHKQSILGVRVCLYVGYVFILSFKSLSM